MTLLENTLLVVLAGAVVYIACLRGDIAAQQRTMRAYGIYPSSPPFPLTAPAPPRQGHIPPQPMPAPAPPRTVLAGRPPDAWATAFDWLHAELTNLDAPDQRHAATAAQPAARVIDLRQPTYAEWLATRPRRPLRVICELIPVDKATRDALARAEHFDSSTGAHFERMQKVARSIDRNQERYT